MLKTAKQMQIQKKLKLETQPNAILKATIIQNAQTNTKINTLRRTRKLKHS